MTKKQQDFFITLKKFYILILNTLRVNTSHRKLTDNLSFSEHHFLLSLSSFATGLTANIESLCFISNSRPCRLKKCPLLALNCPLCCAQHFFPLYLQNFKKVYCKCRLKEEGARRKDICKEEKSESPLLLLLLSARQ